MRVEAALLIYLIRLSEWLCIVYIDVRSFPRVNNDSTFKVKLLTLNSALSQDQILKFYIF